MTAPKIIALAASARRISGVWALHESWLTTWAVTHVPTGRSARGGMTFDLADELLTALGDKLPRLGDGLAFGADFDPVAMGTLRKVIASVCGEKAA